MKVVSNSTCIIALSRIGRLNILKELFREIVILREVYGEISIRDKLGYDEIEKADFLKVK